MSSVAYLSIFLVVSGLVVMKVGYLMSRGDTPVLVLYIAVGVHFIAMGVHSIINLIVKQRDSKNTTGGEQNEVV